MASSWVLKTLNETKDSQVFWLMFAYLLSVLPPLRKPAGNRRLLHSSAEHLIRCNEHNADDKRDGEGTNQAFTHTCVFFLLCWARCGKIKKKTISTSKCLWKWPWVLWNAICLRHTVNVHMGLWTVQVALLSHDDVLNVFHGEVVTESIVKQPLQLVHSQFLHVTLGRHKTPRKVWLVQENPPNAL